MDGIPVMLVGNKCDEESGKREVSKKTGEALQVILQKIKNKLPPKNCKKLQKITNNYKKITKKYKQEWSQSVILFLCSKQTDMLG